MIKQGIVNYFKNLKYFFTPLGTLALGFVFGLSVLVPGTVSAVSALADNVQTVVSDTAVDFSALKDSVVSAVQALPWSNPLDAIRTMTSHEWLMQTLNECVSAFAESTDVYTAQFNIAIHTFTHDMSLYFSALIAFTILGTIGGYLLTKYLIRKNIAKRAWWKYFLHSLIDSLLSAIFTVLCIWLSSVWKPSILLSTLFALFLFGFISLWEAYILHAWKKVAVKKVVNGANIAKLCATDSIIFISAAITVGIVTALTNVAVGCFIGIAVMEIAFIVIGLNAEAYVKSVAQSETSIPAPAP